ARLAWPEFCQRQWPAVQWRQHQQPIYRRCGPRPIRQQPGPEPEDPEEWATAGSRPRIHRRLQVKTAPLGYRTEARQWHLRQSEDDQWPGWSGWPAQELAEPGRRDELLQEWESEFGFRPARPAAAESESAQTERKSEFGVR